MKKLCNYKIYDADGHVIAAGLHIKIRKKYIFQTFKDMMPDGKTLYIQYKKSLFKKVYNYIYSISPDGKPLLVSKYIE